MPFVPTPVGMMDNCCTCGGGRNHAAVLARFFWPGWAPFTTTGGVFDTLGVRYLNIAVNIFDDVGAGVTKSLTSDDGNGCIIDPVTGSDASADGTWTAGWGLRGPTWPPDSISSDGTIASWASGMSIVLSNPRDAAFCAAQAQAILDSIALSGLLMGTDSRDASNDINGPVPSTAADGLSYTIDWVLPGIFAGPESPPGSGINTQVWAWGSARTLALYTTDGGIPAIFTPFYNEAYVIKNVLSSFDVPPSPGSSNGYEQEGWWQMRKSISNMVSAPVCCEDDYFGYDSSSPPAPVCQMINDDMHGHLILTPPSLAFHQPDNSRIIGRTPSFGTVLTGGGCPCH